MYGLWPDGEIKVVVLAIIDQTHAASEKAYVNQTHEEACCDIYSRRL